MKPTLVIMAAGLASRYGSAKQIEKFGPSGETIIDYSVYDAIKVGFGKIVFVIRKNFDQDFREAVTKKFENKIAIEFVYQEIDAIPKGISYSPERIKPWGTGHAVLLTKNVVKEPFVVINGDDFYGVEAFQSIVNFFANNPEENYAMLGFTLKKTVSEHGFVSRGVCNADINGFLINITERTQLKPVDGKYFFVDEQNQQQEIDANTTVSMNFWGFYPDIFEHLENGFNQFIKENAMNLKSEYFLPVLVQQLIDEKKAKVKILTTDSFWFGVTFKEDKPTVIENLKRLTENGIYPVSLWEN